MIRLGAGMRAVASVAVLGGAVLAFALPAAATATATDGDSVTVNQDTKLTIRTGQALSIAATAHGRPCSTAGAVTRKVTLSLVGPAGKDSATELLKSARRPCQQDVSFTDSIAAPKRNGSYTVTLENGGPAQTTTAELNVLIPPAKTKHLKVRTSSSIASFTWTANPETDVKAYQVATTQGYVAATAKVKRSCSGSSCAAAVNMGAQYLGSTVDFVVRAERCGRSCGHRIVGPDSKPAPATFEGAPPPPPSPAPSPISTPPGAGPPPGDGGGSGSGTGAAQGSGSLGATGPGHGGHRHGTGTGGPLQSSPPPISSPQASSQPSVSVEAPAPGAATATAKTSRSTLRAVAHDLDQALQAAPVWRGIAAAVVLLLIGGHLRTWSRRVDPT